MIPLYEGKRDIYSFLEFYKNVEKSEGLSREEIQLIKEGSGEKAERRIKPKIK